ncbi:MAG: conjugal transfer protein TraF, partial [Elusimicrobia bacterium]|nr:conjugal transfer protein TraF [Elusimicrobiota bacterium]
PDDSTAMVLNVAGMSSLPAPELYLMASRLNAGLDTGAGLTKNFMTAGLPTRLGSFGLAVGEFKAAGLMAERTYALGFARSLGRLARFGISGKLLQHAFSPQGDKLAEGDPVFKNGTSKSAFGLDVGLLASPLPMLDVGLAVRNVNQPDVGLASVDRVPRGFRGGMALRFSGIGVTATGELAMRSGPNTGPWSTLVPSVGLEKTLMNGLVAFRVGGGPAELSGGVGLRRASFGFDYSFSWSRTLGPGGFGSHLIGVRYQFAGKGAP